jgi:hypothetical protein
LFSTIISTISAFPFPKAVKSATFGRVMTFSRKSAAAISGFITLLIPTFLKASS